MQGLRSKAAAGAIGALLLLLPPDEGGVGPNGSKPYIDIAGVRTVCYGHVSPKIENRWYSVQECENLLKLDIVRHMKQVESCTTRDIPKNMLIAFTSFDFNTGGFCSSRAKREFNKGQDKEACNAMAYNPSGKPAWSFVNGTTYVDGLFKRRLRERAKCLDGVG